VNFKLWKSRKNVAFIQNSVMPFAATGKSATTIGQTTTGKIARALGVLKSV
jgi:hypothetical protein